MDGMVTQILQEHKGLLGRVEAWGQFSLLPCIFLFHIRFRGLEEKKDQTF